MEPAGNAKTTARSRVRMPPSMRREMILEAAVEYFANHGFAAEIRQFARDNGISPALVFKYFDGKVALIDAVYETVFETRWDENWQTMIRDRDVPLPLRLEAFYNSYLAKVDDRNWIRIAMRASLDGSGLTRRYLADHVSLILKLIADEIDIWFGAQRPGLDQERSIERVWRLQSTIIYYLIRKHIHEVEVMQDRPAFVKDMIAEFFAAPVRSVDSTPQ